MGWPTRSAILHEKIYSRGLRQKKNYQNGQEEHLDFQVSEMIWRGLEMNLEIWEEKFESKSDVSVNFALLTEKILYLSVADNLNVSWSTICYVT